MDSRVCGFLLLNLEYSTIKIVFFFFWRLWLTFASYLINDPSILVSVKYIINILLNSLTLPTSEKNTVFFFFFFPRNKGLKCFKRKTTSSFVGKLSFSDCTLNTWLENYVGDSRGKESAYNSGDPGSIPGLEEPLEKGMKTHSSILAWRIPWTEEPGGYSRWGGKSVTRLSDFHFIFQYI